jgi:hypothetical protein
LFGVFSGNTLRKNAVIAQAYEAKELTSVQEVKLQNTEGDDFDAKIDKMVSQTEDKLTSSQLSRLKELLKQNDRESMAYLTVPSRFLIRTGGDAHSETDGSINLASSIFPSNFSSSSAKLIGVLRNRCLMGLQEVEFSD